MFRKYGFLGIFLILFAELNFILKIQPFALWYIPIIWWGYILVVDALVYKISHQSLMISQPKRFWFLVLLSIPLWGIFEGYNLYLQNWYYVNYTLATHLINFTIIFPAIFETYYLLKSIHLFDRLKLKKCKISKSALWTMIILGLISVILPFIFPKYAFPLLWIGFFLLLDPLIIYIIIILV